MAGKHSKTPTKRKQKIAIGTGAAVLVLAAVAAMVLLLFPNALGTQISLKPLQSLNSQEDTNEGAEEPQYVLAEDLLAAVAQGTSESLLPFLDGEVYHAPQSAELSMEGLSQLPDLPSGCEITSACGLLVYRGIDVAPRELNEYLPQGWSNRNAHEAFVGYCTQQGWFVYTEPVVGAVNTYLQEHDITEYEAIDLSGTEPADLYANYIARGVPVAVWVTTYLQPRTFGDAWTINGEYFYASRQDHAMDLYGYTPDTVILMDPLGDGHSEYSKEAFETIYRERDMHAMAVVKTQATDA